MRNNENEWMLIRLVYQKCIKNGLTGNDIPSHLLYCLTSRNTRNLWMMTSHSKKKRESRKVDQKQERWTRKVDQKLERPFCNLYPRTQVSLRAKWPTDWISTGVLYLSISRECKTTTWFVARGHRSLVAGLSYNKKSLLKQMWGKERGFDAERPPFALGRSRK